MDILNKGLELGLVKAEDIRLITDIAIEDENFREYSMNYIIHIAVENGMLNLIKYLVENGADVTSYDNWAIRFASLHGQLETVKYLVSTGADVTSYDNASIQWASENGHLETVKYLASMGADITARDHWSVWVASLRGHINIVEFLLSKGADFERLTPKHKIYFKQKRAYSRWRRGYLRRWIRRVLTPLYFSPENRGGIQAKKELEAVFHE